MSDEESETVMSETQQRPEPRFKVGQIVVVAEDEFQFPNRITEVKWGADLPFPALHRGWVYMVDPSRGWSEHNLRPLSIDEIGSDELTELAQRLLAADARVETSQRVSDSLLAKLKSATELIKAKDELQSGMMRDNLAVSATLGERETERDEALAKLAASRGLCGRMLQSFRECAGNLNFARTVMDAESRKLAGGLLLDYRAVIAEAEAELAANGGGVFRHER